MKAMAGYGATIELTDDSLTIRGRKTERVLPLAAIASMEFSPCKGFTSGYIRAVLVANWLPPKKPLNDENTVTFISSKENSDWEAFAADITSRAAAVPKMSLPEYSHHAGSGWPASADVEKPAAMTASTRKRSVGERIDEWAVTESNRFEGVAVKDDRISYHGQYQPVAGVHVRVDTAGELQRRATLTRTAAGGLAFGPAGAVVGALFKKQVDKRELYLLVDGEVFAWSVKVDPSKGSAARTFAARVNSIARQ